jgi:hypothetical protein
MRKSQPVTWRQALPSVSCIMCVVSVGRNKGFASIQYPCQSNSDHIMSKHRVMRGLVTCLRVAVANKRSEIFQRSYHLVFAIQPHLQTAKDARACERKQIERLPVACCANTRLAITSVRPYSGLWGTSSKQTLCMVPLIMQY